MSCTVHLIFLMPLTLISPNSSRELERLSPHRSTPGELSDLVLLAPLLIRPPSCLIRKGCSLGLTQVISRCHLIGLLTSHGGNSFTFPPIPACLAYYPIMVEHFLQQLPKKESWVANFSDLSCLSENRLILLLHLADNPARYRTPDWRLFSLKFRGKSSMSCMFHYCSWEVRFLILCKGPTFFSLKTFKKNAFYSQALSDINVLESVLLLIHCT